MEFLTKELIGLLVFGLILGIKHAFESDHLAAIAILAKETGKLTPAISKGLLWGVGHLATLLLIGILILFLKIEVSAAIIKLIEVIVGIIIVFAGIQLISARKKNEIKIHEHKHNHGKKVHKHLHIHPYKKHFHFHNPFLMGALQGLAGSAFLMLLVLTATKGISEGILFITIFGAGSIISMIVIGGIIATPFLLTKNKNLQRILEMIIGILSILIGLSLIKNTLIV